MARIAGVDLPRNKRIVIALQYIYGVGENARAEALEAAGIPDTFGPTISPKRT
jgi:small subunit ribosomal protein S13